MRRLLMTAVLVLLALTFVQLWSLDGLNGGISPLIFGEETRYAAGYSDAAFRRVKPGMSESDVRQLLGAPLFESWDFSSNTVVCDTVHIQGGIVRAAYVFRSSDDRAACNAAVPPGTSTTSVLARQGPPTEMSWLYSDSPTGRSYRERIVKFRGQTVIRRVSALYVD